MMEGLALAAQRDGMYKRGHCFSLEHDLFGKPLSIPDQVRGRLFPDHAPMSECSAVW